MVKIKINCSYCGKEIYKPKYYIEKRKNTYCSKKCNSNHRKKLTTGKNNPNSFENTKKKYYNCKCNYCGKKIHKQKNRISKYNYCSRNCYLDYIKNPILNEIHRKDRYYNCKCNYCGKFIHKRKSYLDAYKRHYCSRECYFKHKQYTAKDKNNSNFMHDKKPNFICSYCGKKSRKSPNYIKRSNYHYCNRDCYIQSEIKTFTKLNPLNIYRGNAMRSSWEKKFAIWLDEHNLHWKYEPRAFKCGKLGLYFPDFYVKEWDTYVEIKGYEYELGMQKFDKAVKTYNDLNFMIFDKPILKNMGIL